jgi:hypothetical protein
MRGFMRQAGSGAVVAICLISLVAAASASAGLSPTGTITAEVSKKNIYFDRSIKVSGVLTTDDIVTPPSPAGCTVTLYERLYPYASEAAVGTTTTNDDGEYTFTDVEPGYNARYRAAVDDCEVDATSEELPVWVYPRGHPARAHFVGLRRVSARFRMDFSDDYPVDMGGRRATWYFSKGESHVYKSIDHSRTRQPRPGKVEGHTRFRIPRGRYGHFYVGWCFEVTDIGEDTGMGKPPTNEKCPKRFRAGRKAQPKTAAPSRGGRVAAARPTRANL